MGRVSSLITRRQFVVGASMAGPGLLVGCGRLPWEAAPPAKVPRVGWLGARTNPLFPEAFRQGLRDLGYVEGATIIIEHRSAEGMLALLPDLAAELIHLPVDILVTEDQTAAFAASDASNTTPIVMGNGDPVGSGLVPSQARPGGNV